MRRGCDINLTQDFVPYFRPIFNVYVYCRYTHILTFTHGKEWKKVDWQKVNKRCSNNLVLNNVLYN